MPPPKEITMKNKLKNPVLLLALLLVPAALSVAPGTAQATVRYCCTPQQISACLATGGTTSCRTNVCQCLF
jgi:ABC-type nitrate/sulfonate/bicarbonate transport system substrate-binding protein